MKLLKYSINLSLLFSVMLALHAQVIMDQLYNEQEWVAVETTKEGIFIAEKKIPGISVKAVRVSQVLDLDPETIASVVEDVSNYNRFLNSAGGLDCRLLEKQEFSLVGYQHVQVPMISDRSYAFRMFRPDPAETRVDWQLIPEGDLETINVPDELSNRGSVYIDVGAGSWSMEEVGEGLYQVSYRLIMDPGGWIPNRVSDYFNRVSIVNIFKDAVAEAAMRTGKS